DGRVNLGWLLLPQYSRSDPKAKWPTEPLFEEVAPVPNSTPADGPPAASDEGRQWTQVFSVRLVRERALDTPIVTTPADVARVFSEYLGGCDREHFVVALLSTRAQLIGLHTCHVGALSSCIVSIRDVFKVALLANAASIVVGHNHPSGNLEPSREDIRIT